jgi:hypothetical protein
MATDTAESGTFPVLAIQPPVIPGWATSYDVVAKVFRASEPDPLTPYQLEHGCVTKLVASGPRELEALCHAQTALAVFLARAEKLARAEAIAAQEMAAP